MFSFVGETVFDPFMGSGTTALAARNLQRNSIGYEINPEYKNSIEKRLHRHHYSDMQRSNTVTMNQLSLSTKG